MFLPYVFTDKRFVRSDTRPVTERFWDSQVNMAFKCIFYEISKILENGPSVSMESTCRFPYVPWATLTLDWLLFIFSISDSHNVLPFCFSQLPWYWTCFPFSFAPRVACGMRSTSQSWILSAEAWAFQILATIIIIRLSNWFPNLRELISLFSKQLSRLHLTTKAFLNIQRECNCNAHYNI